MGMEDEVGNEGAASKFGVVTGPVGEWLRSLSPDEQEAVDRALNDVGMAPEVVANMVDDGEPVVAANVRAVIEASLAAPDNKSRAAAMRRLHDTSIYG